MEHINCRCNYKVYSGKMDYSNCLKNVFTTSLSTIDSNKNVKTNEENILEENILEVEDMSLKIEKTDKLSVEEFKETEKCYDKIDIKIDSEKLDKFEEEYGMYNFTLYLRSGVYLRDETIQFLPKALRIIKNIDEYCVPYDWITEIKCTYYITRN